MGKDGFLSRFRKTNHITTAARHVDSHLAQPFRDLSAELPEPLYQPKRRGGENWRVPTVRQQRAATPLATVLRLPPASLQSSGLRHYGIQGLPALTQQHRSDTPAQQRCPSAPSLHPCRRLSHPRQEGRPETLHR